MSRDERPVPLSEGNICVGRRDGAGGGMGGVSQVLGTSGCGDASVRCGSVPAEKGYGGRDQPLSDRCTRLLRLLGSAYM